MMSKQPRRATSQKELNWEDPGAQPWKAKMLDALVLNCPKHPRRVIESAKRARYVGRTARPCSCADLAKRTIRAIDAFQQTNKLCWPSVATLAKRAGCSDRTIQRGLRLVQNWGYVKIVPQSGKATSHYSINWPRIWDETEERGCHEKSVTKARQNRDATPHLIGDRPSNGFNVTAALQDTRPASHSVTPETGTDEKPGGFFQKTEQEPTRFSVGSEFGRGPRQFVTGEVTSCHHFEVT